LISGFLNLGWRDSSDGNTEVDEPMLSLSLVKEAFPKADIEYVNVFLTAQTFSDFVFQLFYIINYI
jgi:hypothetical protein